jgi:hypothetical protein
MISWLFLMPLLRVVVAPIWSLWMSTTVKLTTPVEAYGEVLSEITFRKPVGKDLRKTGLPNKTTTNEDGVQVNHVDMEVMAKLMVLLGSVPMGAIDSLSMQDFLACSSAVSDFFGQSEAPTKTSSTGSTISHGNGSAIQKPS